MSKSVSEKVEIGDSVVFQELNDEAVLLNLATQDYYTLDDVGAKMWNLLVEHGKVETVVTHLAYIYEAEENTLRGDLHSLIRQLIESNLLKWADG